MYLDEEDSRYYMPLKEYLAYCESLRLEPLDTHSAGRGSNTDTIQYKIYVYNGTAVCIM